jgi:UDP-glucose 4-epimerase
MAAPLDKKSNKPRAPSALSAGKGKIVAITGAASFLGRNLVGVLEEDERIQKIIAIDIKAPPTGKQKTRLYEVDLTAASSEERVAEILEAERVQVLVHMGFLSSPTFSTRWAHELESVGTMHLLGAARQVRLPKLVMWSQTALYGAHPTNPNFLTERHPLRADAATPFFADKISAEADVTNYAAKSRGTVVTVLRTATILGPTVRNYVTRYLDRRVVPTLLGFDPLWQFVHEVDAVAAFKLAVDEDFPGVFNVVGDGVLPLSTVIRLAGKTSLPILHTFAEPLAAALWVAHVAEAPPSFLSYLRYVCVADGDKASRVMRFTPAYSTREALLDYISAQRLRDARLLQERPA